MRSSHVWMNSSAENWDLLKTLISSIFFDEKANQGMSEGK